MVNITNHQGNTNQNQNDLSIHFSKNDTIKKNDKDALKRTFAHCWRECKLVKPLWKAVEV
jgi:hypothetical protein